MKTITNEIKHLTRWRKKLKQILQTKTQWIKKKERIEQITFFSFG